MNQMISIFKILSDETRLRIVLLLAQQELCVCQLSGILEVSQPKISKNLAKLRDLNLVTDERQDKFVYYRLKTDNTLLMDTLQMLLKEIDDSEQLKLDQMRLLNKGMYLIKCNGIEVE